MAPKTSSTPGRGTRSAAARSLASEPLPAIDSKHSQAYGSPGKTHLQRQMRATSTDFAAEFGTSRRRRNWEPSVPESVAEDSTRASSPDRRNDPNPFTDPPHLPAVTAQDVDTDDSMRPATALDSQVFYNQDLRPRLRPGSQVPRSSPLQQQQSQRQQQQAEQPQNASPPGQYTPTRLRVFLRTLPRYLPRLIANRGAKDLLIASFVFFLLLVAFILAPAPASLVAYRQDFAERVIFTISPSDWKPIHQSVANRMISNRLDALENSVDELKMRMNLQQEGLEALRDALPDTLVIRRVDGEWQIPSEFWPALAEKMATDGSAPLWDSFIAANQDRLDRVVRGFLNDKKPHAPGTPQDSISRDDFLLQIEQNNEHMQRHFADLLHDAQKTILTRATGIAQNVSEETVMRSPTFRLARLQVSALGYANHLHNAHEAVKATNWFAIGLGARIDPKLTSPTMDKNAPSLFPWLYSKISGYPKLLPPIAALQEWREAGQCWCAAPSVHGKAQITIMTPEKIFPETLVIEHSPATATLDIAAAPRDIEIWAEVPSKAHAERISELIKANVPPTEFNQCGKPPASNYVCIGTGKYDIHYDNWVQTMRTFVNTQEMGLAVDKISVRARTNWGQDWTCFYRLRMTGQRVFNDSPKDMQE